MRDPSAIAVLERAELQGEWDPVVFAWRREVALRLRYLERAPLGTPYAEVVGRVRAMTRSVELAGQCRLVVDATGVGRPVVELLRSADLGCGIIPVMVTGGDTETWSSGYYRVPKRDLIAGVQVLLQNGELQIAAGLAGGGASEGDGGDAGEDHGGGARAVRGVAGGGA